MINPMMIKQLMQMSRGGNPNQLMQVLMNKNPQASQLFNQMQASLKNSGMSGKDFAMQYAKQNGIDQNDLLELAKALGIK